MHVIKIIVNFNIINHMACTNGFGCFAFVFLAWLVYFSSFMFFARCFRLSTERFFSVIYHTYNIL